MFIIMLVMIGMNIAAIVQAAMGNIVVSNVLIVLSWLPIICGAVVKYYFQCKSEYDSKNKQ